MNDINELLEIAKEIDSMNYLDIAYTYGAKHKMVISPNHLRVIRETLEDWKEVEIEKELNALQDKDNTNHYIIKWIKKNYSIGDIYDLDDILEELATNYQKKN